jgi:hypothetical protein
MPSETNLVEELDLEPIFESDDGAIYRCGHLSG